jgi:hypothetical protein
LLAIGRLIYEKDLLVTFLFLNVLSVICRMVHMSYAFVSSKLPISAANLQYISYKLLGTLICGVLSNLMILKLLLLWPLNLSNQEIQVFNLDDFEDYTNLIRKKQNWSLISSSNQLLTYESLSQLHFHQISILLLIHKL